MSSATNEPHGAYHQVPRLLVWSAAAPVDLFREEDSGFRLSTAQGAELPIASSDSGASDAVWIASTDVDALRRHVMNGVFRSARLPGASSDECGLAVFDACRVALQASYDRPTAHVPFQLAKAAGEAMVQTILRYAELAPRIGLRSGDGSDPVSHAVRVAALSVALSQRLGITDPAELVRLGLGALFHDFGMSSVPQEILAKKGQLSSAERSQMQSHAERGADLLTQLGGHNVDIKPVLHHHERFNGTGYPRGFKGDAIPFSARVVAVVDVYKALTSRRPYMSARSSDDAAALMTRRMPGHFDPTVLSQFVRLLKQRWAMPEAEPSPGELRESLSTSA